MGRPEPADGTQHHLDLELEIRAATEADVAAILRALQANAADTSLFQEPEHQVRRTLGDFLLAVDGRHQVLGCAALRSG